MACDRRAFLAGALLGCGCKKPLSPEEQVRATIGAAEKAAEAKDLGALAELVSAGYSDREQNDRQVVLNLLKVQFIRFPAIYLLVRIPGVVFPQPGQAEAVVLVAMAGVPFERAAEFTQVHADLYRFDLLLADEGKGRWRVVRASWGPAGVEDFL
jgi:hypothetical protein